MNTTIGHLVYGIDMKNVSFYRDLMTFLGWTTLFEAPEMIGFGVGKTSIWLGKTLKQHDNDYDGPGLNHVGIHTESIADVDATVAYLKAHNVPALFETPRARPEFSGEGGTYYQVMFETPDRILIEVVYSGPTK